MATISATDALHYLVVRSTYTLSDGSIIEECVRLEDTPGARAVLAKRGLRILPDPALSPRSRILMRQRDNRRAQSN